MDSVEYANILNDLRDRNYTFENFHHQKPREAAILRHDIDFCIPSALEMAYLENGFDISATYFFMITTNTYNLASSENRTLVKKIEALGHTISLHFDPAAHENIDEGFEIEKHFFESLFDVEIKIVSLHRPRGFIEDNNRKLRGCPHTYEDKYFQGMKYMSDSGGKFSYGHPLESPELWDGKNLHLLFHPIWWTNPGKTPSDKLRHWQSRQFAFLNRETSLNCKAFDSVRAK